MSASTIEGVDFDLKSAYEINGVNERRKIELPCDLPF